jgi:hypothetical protein
LTKTLPWLQVYSAICASTRSPKMPPGLDSVSVSPALTP